MCTLRDSTVYIFYYSLVVKIEIFINGNLYGHGMTTRDFALLEIAGGWQKSPVFESLQAPAIYRELEEPYLNREAYRAEGKLTLDHHHRAPGIDALTLQWDAADIPYPFENESFDQIHCHMITAPVVRDNAAGGEQRYPTSADYAHELHRLTKAGGKFYLSLQSGLLGGGFIPTRTGYYTEFVEKVELFNEELNKVGFATDFLQYGRPILARAPSSVRTQRNEIDIGIITKLSRVWHCADALLIASKK